MGGNNIKTTDTLKKGGGYRATRHRDRADQKPAPGEPRMPDGLIHSEDTWRRVLEYFRDRDALGELDTEALTELCRTYDLMVEARAAAECDVTAKDPRIAYCSYFDRWYRLMREFGGTPLARASLKVPPKNEEEEDPFEILSDRYGLN